MKFVINVAVPDVDCRTGAIRNRSPSPVMVIPLLMTHSAQSSFATYIVRRWGRPSQSDPPTRF